MCCARTAALQVAMKSPSEDQYGFPGSDSCTSGRKEAARRIVRKRCRSENTTNALYSNTVFQTAPRAGQNLCRRNPKPFKIKPGGAQAHPDVTKSLPRAPKRHPKDAEERPRCARERARSAQERPKDVQNTPRRLADPFKIDPDAPHDASWTRFLQEPLFEKVQDTIFDRFPCMASQRKP